MDVVLNVPSQLVDYVNNSLNIVTALNVRSYMSDTTAECIFKMFGKEPKGLLQLGALPWENNFVETINRTILTRYKSSTRTDYTAIVEFICTFYEHLANQISSDKSCPQPVIELLYNLDSLVEHIQHERY